MTMTMDPAPGDPRPRRVTMSSCAAQLEQWLEERIPGSKVSALIVPESNGMSSETVLFDLTVPGESSLGARGPHRSRPGGGSGVHGLRHEATVRNMEMVAEHTKVPSQGPVARRRDRHHRRALFVMERVNGIVPPDVLPYTFGDNWFFESDLADQQRLERKAVEWSPNSTS